MVRMYGTVVKAESGTLYDDNSVTSPRSFDTYKKETNVPVPFDNVIAEMRQTMRMHAGLKEDEPTADKIPREVLKCPALHGTNKPTSLSLSYFNENHNIASTVQNIIADVHRTMKTVSPPNRAPSIPAAIADKSSKDQETKQKKKRRMRGGQNRSRINIPTMKANYSQRVQLNMRRGNGVNGFNDSTFASQRRLREVLQQKTMLQTMLTEHRRLQRDRLTIAMDIQKMRNDLDKIRHILDTSLQNLKSTQTFASKITGRPVVPVSISHASSNSNNPVSRRGNTTYNASNSGGLRKRHALIKSGSVSTKRQMVTRTKRPMRT